MYKHKTFIYLTLITASLTIILTACSTLQPTPPENYHRLTWSKRLIQLNSLNKWSLRGSFSIHYANRTDIASYQWKQNHENYQIKISSPLNLVHLDLYGNKQQITLQKSAHEIYTATTPEELLAQQVGWELPIANLVYWIKGMPAPESHYKIKLDCYNHLIALKQQGWLIKYPAFTEMNGIDLPHTINLENPQLKIKMVVKEWKNL